MYSHVVLLRGVNVGKVKRVPMASFATLLRKLGCTDVTTILNSGNAVVAIPSTSANKLAHSIAQEMRNTFGFDVSVVVKSARTFRLIVSENKLAANSADPSKLLVAFTQTSQAIKALEPIARSVHPPERFLLASHAAYLYCPNGILKSKAMESLLGGAGFGVTTRNWSTVLKLQELLADGAA